MRSPIAYELHCPTVEANFIVGPNFLFRWFAVLPLEWFTRNLLIFTRSGEGYFAATLRQLRSIAVVVDDAEESEGFG